MIQSYMKGGDVKMAKTSDKAAAEARKARRQKRAKAAKKSSKK